MEFRRKRCSSPCIFGPICLLAVVQTFDSPQSLPKAAIAQGVHQAAAAKLAAVFAARAVMFQAPLSSAAIRKGFKS